VGKEGILGLTQAIERYLSQPKTSGSEMVQHMTPFIDQLNQLPGVTARVVWDSAGRDIARTEIHFDEALTGWATGDLVQALKNGDIAIYFRGYKANESIIEADVRSVTAAQLQTIFSWQKGTTHEADPRFLSGSSLSQRTGGLKAERTRHLAGSRRACAGWRAVKKLCQPRRGAG